MWIVNTWPFYVKINKDRTRLNGTEHTLNLTLSISLTHHYCSESLNAVKVSMGPKLFYSLSRHSLIHIFLLCLLLESCWRYLWFLFCLFVLVSVIAIFFLLILTLHVRLQCMEITANIMLPIHQILNFKINDPCGFSLFVLLYTTSRHGFQPFLFG